MFLVLIQKGVFRMVQNVRGSSLFRNLSAGTRLFMCWINMSFYYFNHWSECFCNFLHSSHSGNQSIPLVLELSCISENPPLSVPYIHEEEASLLSAWETNNQWTWILVAFTRKIYRNRDNNSLSTPCFGDNGHHHAYHLPKLSHISPRPFPMQTNHQKFTELFTWLSRRV